MGKMTLEFNFPDVLNCEIYILWIFISMYEKISNLDHTMVKIKVFYDEFNQRLVFSEYSEISVERRLEISWKWSVYKKQNEFLRLRLG